MVGSTAGAARTPDNYVAPQERIAQMTRAMRAAKLARREQEDTLCALWGADGAAQLRSIARWRAEHGPSHRRRLRTRPEDVADVCGLYTSDSEGELPAAVTTLASERDDAQDNDDPNDPGDRRDV